MQMICMCGEDNALENFTDIGLFLGVSDQSSHTGKLEAMIQFDIGKFVQYYVPTADLASYEAVGYIPREDFGKLSDVELQIGSTRRSRNLF
ncbi:hypothetical protein HBI60_253250 [Parastagonospora nodorum]|nr:hypothetical protein HBI60_253250 [Parastagonospora nodorum]